MGEHLGGDSYRVFDVTVQRILGGRSWFERKAYDAIRQMDAFFEKTDRQYVKYNYLGEWHSHPLFPPSPSIQDSKTMWDIVHDPLFGARFAALLIIGVGQNGLEIKSYAYIPGIAMHMAETTRE